MVCGSLIELINSLRDNSKFKRDYNMGDIVCGQKYEFENCVGTVVEQLSKTFILVNFDNFPHTVCTTVDNLKAVVNSKLVM